MNSAEAVAIYKSPFKHSNNLYFEVVPKAGISRIIIEFTIDTTGRAVFSRLERLNDPTLEQEAQRVINLMPLWTPSMYEGKPVKMTLKLPVIQ